MVRTVSSVKRLQGKKRGLECPRHARRSAGGASGALATGLPVGSKLTVVTPIAYDEVAQPWLPGDILVYQSGTQPTPPFLPGSGPAFQRTSHESMHYRRFSAPFPLRQRRPH